MSNKLEQIVNEIKFRKGWGVEQVAKSIGYSRVHLTKEMKRPEGNEEIESLLLKEHKDILQNVAKDTPGGYQGRMDDLIRSNADIAESNRALARSNERLVEMLRSTVGGREGMKEADASMFGTILDLVLRVGVDAGSWKTVAEGKKELGKQASDNAPDKKLTGKN